MRMMSLLSLNLHLYTSKDLLPTHISNRDCGNPCSTMRMKGIPWQVLFSVASCPHLKRGLIVNCVLYWLVLFLLSAFFYLLQASLTVWWIILRFMGDLPEPKQERVSEIADPIQRNLGQRQARRLSNLVGLDQVNNRDTIINLSSLSVHLPDVLYSLYLDCLTCWKDQPVYIITYNVICWLVLVWY